VKNLKAALILIKFRELGSWSVDRKRQK